MTKRLVKENIKVLLHSSPLSTHCVCYGFSAAELQFYPGVAGVLIQTPVLHMAGGRDAISGLSLQTAVTLVAAGFFYYLQTATAYMLMEYISPVTYR